MSWFQNMKVPHKFKAPDLEKYSGTDDPMIHLQMYCRKMACYAGNEPLLILTFQDTLTGQAAVWFSRLKKMTCWKEFADMFLAQYGLNVHSSPDRFGLQRMEKKRCREEQKDSGHFSITGTGRATCKEDPSQEKGRKISDDKQEQWEVETSPSYLHMARQYDDPPPRDFDPNATYHGILKFEGVLNIKTNPFPNHPEGGVSAILVEEVDCIDLSTIQVPWKKLFYALKAQSYLDLVEACYEELSKGICKYHSNAHEHNLEDCEDFKKKIASLCERGIIQKKITDLARECMMINQIVTTRGIENKVEEAEVDNLSSGFGGITRNGRCYTSEELEKTRKELGKDVEDPLKKKITEGEAHVPKDITAPSFENMVTAVLAINRLTISDDELPLEGRGHVKALHITMKTRERIVAKVLIDNGSALNVCPMSTLDKLGIDQSSVRASNMIIKAFDGTRREAMVVNSWSDTIFSPLEDEVYYCFKFVSVIHKVAAVKHEMPKAIMAVAREFIRLNFQPGKGLGSSNQGIPAMIAVKENKDGYGLSYIPTRKDHQQAFEMRRLKTLAKVKGGKMPEKNMVIPYIRTTFSAPTMVIHPDEIVKLEDEEEEELILLFAEDFEVNTATCEEIIPPPIRLYEPGEIARKWTVMPLPRMISVELIALLKEYRDIFAWSYQDMHGLDTDIVVHQISLKPECKPVRQLLHRIKPETILKIKEEVEKQLNAGFLSTVTYSDWVANIVLVPKKDGKVQMCIDYQDLNRASPKDNFPLPHIDTLVDNTATNVVFSFMDGFSGYNQIKMANEDNLKIAFITHWGTFVYDVMSFDLKNARATYQCAMVTLFHNMIHQEIEVYVDDMIAKSCTLEGHLVDLLKLFQRLRKYRLRLNPNKCIFGVTSRKLLGFIVNGRGIKINPSKVQAIWSMPTLKIEKEIWSFLGRINYIARFIAQLTATCEPLLKLLRKDVKIEWTEDCQKAFDKFKEYLLSPPILVPPTTRRPLILYLIVQEVFMGYMLGQQDEAGKKEQTIYYLSKKFTELETRYVLVEKTCSTRANGCRIPNEDVMEIDEDSLCRWKLYFDGVANATRSRIGAILIPPKGQQTPITVKLGFDFTNNMTEYEACIVGLQAALEFGTYELDVFGDSLLIVSQTNGEWKVRDPKLILYQTYISQLILKFKYVTFTYTPRAHNHFADALATLANLIKLSEGDDVQPLQIETSGVATYCVCIEECMSVEAELDGKPWYHNIKCFVQSREYPAEKTENENYIHAEEANQLIDEMHVGLMGAHANGPFLAKKIMRAGYYWLTMESDCMKHVQACHNCQMYQNCKNAPPQYLHTLATPWPFSAWGMDVIGAITPKSSNGYEFILVAIDYFTKWVEACSFKNLYQQYKIMHHNSTPYRPKMNGSVEATNKNVKRILSKMIETYKDWHEQLPYALCTCRTSIRTSTGATPYSLVYGMEAVLPIEVEIPSLRILSQIELDKAEWTQARYKQLNFIDEKRMTTLCHGQLYQRRIEKANNKKTHLRMFKPRDLVLKKLNMVITDLRGKFAASYEGPYVVKKALSGGALILADMDDEEFLAPINLDSIIKYYV
uniref:Uncharacterized protein n=1 Tax=Fagus sylvatica TaxID=28930 RepID=A0A2N9IX63_FAGSY